jgi:hypothetical protein
VHDTILNSSGVFKVHENRLQRIGIISLDMSQFKELLKTNFRNIADAGRLPPNRRMNIAIE